MNILSGYDSDEEFSFNPTDSDWTSEELILQNTKQIREDYVLLNCIGHGSYSSVYKVENKHTHEIMCAKNYYPEIVDKNVHPYSFRDISTHGKREIEMLRKLRHSSILSMHGVYRGRRRGSVYIITELFETNLDELMRTNLLDTMAIKTVCHELLSVLDYLQHQQVIHCDIKPSNILYKKGKIALCDWGSACSVHTVGTLPTLAYRSPEMLLWREENPKELWTAALDLWSWGIVLFELLTKQYFFEGESEISAVNKAVRLAGTVCENAEDRMEFDTLCGKCHLHFPDMQSQLRDFLDNQNLYSQELFELLKACFGLLPKNRKSAGIILQSSWWKEEPSVKLVTELPDYSAELERIREEKRRKMMELWSQLQNMSFVCLQKHSKLIGANRIQIPFDADGEWIDKRSPQNTQDLFRNKSV